MASLDDDFRGIGAAVSDACAGMRVDWYLARFYPFRTRQAWARACRAAELRVNGAIVKPAYRLRSGDVLARFHPLDDEPEVDTRLLSLGEFDGILAIAKPGNLPMHEAGRYRRKTFARAVQEQFGSDWAAVHRLDRETSGIVLCAADPHLRAALAQDFVAHKIHKEYLAITAGVPRQSQWSVDTAIDCPIDTRTARMAQENPVARAAQTHFVVEATAAATALVRAFPRTGRTNQIRIHLQQSGVPIVGDLRFGFGRDRSGVERHFLHATRLSLRHPRSGREVDLNCPLAEDMRQFWQGCCGVAER